MRKLTCRWMLQSKHAIREKKITIKVMFVPTEKFYVLYILVDLNLVKLKEKSESTESILCNLFEYKTLVIQTYLPFTFLFLLLLLILNPYTPVWTFASSTIFIHSSPLSGHSMSSCYFHHLLIIFNPFCPYLPWSFLLPFPAILAVTITKRFYKNYVCRQ